MTHIPHEPYVNAVADALRAAGHAVTEVVANPDDPMNGAITIDDPGRRPLVLGWNEERGWFRGREAAHCVVVDLHDSPLDLLATPDDVVGWTRSVLDGTAKDSPIFGMGGLFRNFDDEDGFAARLAEYAGGAS